MYSSNVLDIGQLILDLIDLHASTGKSEKDFADLAGFNWGKVQRLESGMTKTAPAIEDVDSWLRAGGSSLFLYLGRIAILDELKILSEDLEIAEKFKRALKIPAKRTTLKLFLDGLLADVDAQIEKTRIRQRGVRRVGPENHGKR